MFSITIVFCILATLVNCNPLQPQSESFSTVYKLADGEVVTKVKWNNINAIETRYSHIDLIQIIKDEHRIIQLWLSEGKLVDCEYTNDTHKIAHFHEEFGKVNPNMHKDSHSFKLIRNLSSLPETLSRLTDYEKWEEQCEHHHRMIRTQFVEKKSLSRSKRNLLLMPGTKWCGKGSNSQNFEDLGDYSFADRCCRDHDRCKYNIGPFDKKYHLMNQRFYFVSHCSCDERFRSCLKVANSGTANLVGKIYFNVVQTKCFMFEMNEVCQESTWWGACLQSKRRKRAVFRDPLDY